MDNYCVCETSPEEFNRLCKTCKFNQVFLGTHLMSLNGICPKIPYQET